MSAIVDALRDELKDPEYSEGYAESFLDSYIATQIKVLREQAGLSQAELAKLIGTRQGVISRIENVYYSKWSTATLKKLARAFRVRLKVSFETYGSLLAEVEAFSRQSLQRTPREHDPILNAQHIATPIVKHLSSPHHRDTKRVLVFISHTHNAPGQLQRTLFGSPQFFSDLQFQQYSHNRPTSNLQESAMGAGR
jgi:transcriptional regulator with XRE-family HTH domain